ncbi:MAG: DUF6112 family protein [Solirubrobacteraceae bacterium]
MQKLQGVKRRSVAAIVGLGAPLITATPAFAAAGGSGVTITMNTNGLPGISAAETVVGALITFAVIASVAGVLMGAMTWAVGNHTTNPQIVQRGKTGVLAGVGAAILSGGVMALVNFFFGIGAGL